MDKFIYVENKPETKNLREFLFKRLPPMGDYYKQGQLVAQQWALPIETLGKLTKRYGPVFEVL